MTVYHRVQPMISVNSRDEQWRADWLYRTLCRPCCYDETHAVESCTNVARCTVWTLENVSYEVQSVHTYTVISTWAADCAAHSSSTFCRSWIFGYSASYLFTVFSSILLFDTCLTSTHSFNYTSTLGLVRLFRLLISLSRTENFFSSVTLNSDL